jgi:hypothetical protein
MTEPATPGRFRRSVALSIPDRRHAEALMLELRRIAGGHGVRVQVRREPIAPNPHAHPAAPATRDAEPDRL